MRQPTRALLLAVCKRLDLNPVTISRLSMFPDRVVVDHLDMPTGTTWTETRWLEDRPARRLP